MHEILQKSPMAVIHALILLLLQSNRMFHPFHAMAFDITKVSFDRKIAVGFFVHFIGDRCGRGLPCGRLLFQRTYYFATTATLAPAIALPQPWARSTAAAAAGASHRQRPTRKMGDKERFSSLAPWCESKSYFRKLVLVSFLILLAN